MKPTVPIAQWIECRNLNQKVEGSKPVVVVAFVLYTPYQARKYRDFRQNKKLRIEIKSAFVIESSVLSSFQIHHGDVMTAVLPDNTTLKVAAER